MPITTAGSARCPKCERLFSGQELVIKPGNKFVNPGKNGGVWISEYGHCPCGQKTALLFDPGDGGSIKPGDGVQYVAIQLRID